MTDMSPVKLKVLGPVRVKGSADNDVATRITQPRLLGLLAYLALARPRGLHSRDTVIAMLWPEADQPAGRHALRNALHRLRVSLGDGVIVTARDGFLGLNCDRITCAALQLE